MAEEKLSAWDKMLIVRDVKRPNAKDYIDNIFTDFYEMHGDRYFGDDGAIIGGIARLDGRPVTIIAELKGHNIEDNKKCNFAMPHPEGYRKALRLAKQAEKFHRPCICFIDTPGAYPGVDAEKRGQGEAIARNLFEFMRLRTNIISVVLGEGGSGGALALGVCDALGMLQNSLYSVISPRGAASILWKDAGKEKEACNIMKITADDLYDFGICDEVIEEPAGGAQNDVYKTSENIKDFLSKKISENLKKDIDEMLDLRYNKFRKIGVYKES